MVFTWGRWAADVFPPLFVTVIFYLVVKEMSKQNITSNLGQPPLVSIDNVQQFENADAIETSNYTLDQQISSISEPVKSENIEIVSSSITAKIFDPTLSIDLISESPQVASNGISIQSKNKKVALFLALFLGVFGVHRFYLGNWGWGIIYILMSFTGVTIIIGLLEATRYGFMRKEIFADRSMKANKPFSLF